MLRGIQILLFKFSYCLSADFSEREKHIKGMEACVVHINMSRHTGIFQVINKCKCFTIKCLAVTNKSIGGRQIGKIILP